MPQVNFNNTNQTVRIYDAFYSTDLRVNASEYDLVFSYFKGITKNDITAANFSVILFRIATDGGYDVVDLLQLLKGDNISDTLHMNKVICYYLNTFKNKSSIYGVGQIPKPNEAVQRNVVL